MSKKNKKTLEQVAKQLEEQAASNLTLANKIKNISTKELTNELAIRDGIEEVRVEPYDTIILDDVEIEGPARILINTD